MIKKICGPTVIEAAGNKKKIIEEYFGLVNSKDGLVSIARDDQPFRLARARAERPNSTNTRSC